MNNKYSDEIDREIFEFTRNDKEVPTYVDNAINNAIYKVNSTPKLLLYKLKRIAIIILSLSIMTTGIVWAKDIVNFLKYIFTNSTPGIESAIENEYIQNVDMDFVYNNGIGIKICSLVLDNNILDISFAFDYNKDISNIVINEFSISNEYNELLHISTDKEIVDENNMGINKIEMMNEINSEGNIYYKSILLKYRESLNCKVIMLNIEKISIYGVEKDEKIINGNWNFNISLNNDIFKENSLSYDVEYDSSILSVSNKINETNFLVDLCLYDNINSLVIYDYNNVILNDDNGNTYHVSEMNINDNIIHMEFNYGKYILQNCLNLYIKYDENKSVNIKFIKGASH